MNEHSPDYNKIKLYYNKGIYTATMVYKLYTKGKITIDEYHEIVGGEDE